jgi:hypothetical protein
MAATPASGGGGAYSCETAERTREWMEALAAFLRLHRPLLEAHVVNFFKVLIPPREFFGGLSADWRVCLLRVCVLFGSARAGQAVGASGRRVDGVPPAGVRGELAQAAIRMRPGSPSPSLLVYALASLTLMYLTFYWCEGALACYTARVCAYC